MTTPTTTIAGRAPAWLGTGVLRTQFQPIYHVAAGLRQTYAVEALTRGPEGHLASPVSLFAQAREAGWVAELDRRCILTALETARRLPMLRSVFLNVHPATLCTDSGFSTFLVETVRMAGLTPGQVTVELLEHARMDRRHCPQLHAALRALRGVGMGIAVDDVGAGTEEARRALAFRPDYIKIDAAIVRAARHELRERVLLHAIVELAHDAGTRVVAEGIEEPEDLDLVIRVGIRLAQGYLLCRPLPPEAVAVALERPLTPMAS